ncbi:hypothetical protein ACQ4LE_005251 [Meloidogyne hapla]
MVVLAYYFLFGTVYIGVFVSLISRQLLWNIRCTVPDFSWFRERWPFRQRENNEIEMTNQTNLNQNIPQQQNPQLINFPDGHPPSNSDNQSDPSVQIDNSDDDDSEFDRSVNQMAINIQPRKRRDIHNYVKKNKEIIKLNNPRNCFENLVKVKNGKSSFCSSKGKSLIKYVDFSANKNNKNSFLSLISPKCKNYQKFNFLNGENKRRNKRDILENLREAWENCGHFIAIIWMTANIVAYIVGYVFIGIALF